MTSTGSLLNKPKSVVRRIVNVLFAVVLMLLGAALMITSYQQVDADEELARTGVHVAGTITYQRREEGVEPGHHGGIRGGRRREPLRPCPLGS